MCLLTDISSKQPNWQRTAPKKEIFTSDAVINAYLKGKKDALIEAEKKNIKMLTINLNIAGEQTSTVIKELKKIKIIPESSFLKIISWDCFEILIIVKEKDYLSKKFISVYNKISQLEKKFNHKEYTISFHCTSISKPIDSTHLNADGFILKHKAL